MATDDLEIRGNVIWNGPAGLDLGINDPALAAQVARDNAINTIQPDLVGPASGRFGPVPGGRVASMAGLAIPPFPGGDRPSSPLRPSASWTTRCRSTPWGCSGPPPRPRAPRPEGDGDVPAVPLDQMVRAAVGVIQEGPTVAGLVASTYQRLLGRAPTAFEASVWLGQITRCTSNEEILASVLIGSAEYVRRAGVGGDRAWVASAFRARPGPGPGPGRGRQLARLDRPGGATAR